MSFGFSVGDFVAVGKLIADIITCLQESGGAKTDYQELMRELTALDHALRSLDRMKPSNTSSTALDSIKFSALSCRHLLETFLRKIQKYDRTLGVWAKPGLGKSAVDKVRWNFDGRNEIQALQNYLNQHVNTIHILLAEHGLERLDMAEQRILDDNLRTQERLDKTNEIVLAIKDDMLAQVSAVKTVQYMLSELYRVVCGEMRVSWNTLGQLVANTCVSTQQIYTIVLEIRNHVTSVDTRWSFFQEPVVIEDAFGFKFPVPSEYDFDMLQTIIQLRFKDVPGSSEVRLGNYELCETRCRDKRLNKNARIHPGAEITMAMIVGVASPEVQACPVPSCGSSRVVLHAKGGMIW
ncbi:hypothetical protein B0J11DRAFT_548958 [Dendryphion nanum]|uniref:Ubiquitin-like domain-containing protein n=1 Tax=Dendryphion nanum TaxID=256645 RepID=A0A9P9ITT8_9PLEO|nr:hypothetical protein B0J11DRAFT_548958 [Dendryphion nanum]